jgi:hypothetical protein
MSAIKIIAYIASAILIFFGVLFIWSAFGTREQPGNLVIGIITAGIGFVIIYFAGRISPPASQPQNVTLKVDLPANVAMDTLKCKSCGGALSPENISMVAGAPVVKCPYCGTTYQLTEEPKW